MNESILKGKNCLITGATGSLGIHLAKELAKKGCNLFLISKTPSKLEDLAKQIESEYKNIIVQTEICDLRQSKEIQNTIGKVKDKFDSIDILVNSAGILQFSPFIETELDDFDAMFDINVKATYIFCREFAPGMIRNKWGRIVNIGSSSAYTGFKDTSLYCSSKHAVLGLTRSLFKELIEYNVRSICVSFGTLQSEMGKEVTKKHNLSSKTFLNPKEIAEYIVYTISFDDQLITDELVLNRIHEYD